MSASGFLNSHIVSGMPLLRPGVAAELLWNHRHRIDPSYAGRASFMLLASLLGTALSPLDRVWFGPGTGHLTWNGPVLFILGYWRSGTTLLHELLAADAQFVSPTFVDANAPTCLAAARAIAPWFKPLLPKNRGFDNMALDLKGPWEEEGMLFSFTGRSSYLSIAFPRNFASFDMTLDLQGWSEQEIADWRRAYVLICERITHERDRTPLFKSPPAAARLPWLLRTFPDARFLHISRRPESLFASNLLMMRTVGLRMSLQRESDANISAHVLHQLEVIYNRYFADVQRLPPGRLAEITYEDLLTDPVRELSQAYRTLGLQGFEGLCPTVKRMMAARKDYRPNVHATLPSSLRDALASRWALYERMWHRVRTTSAVSNSAA